MDNYAAHKHPQDQGLAGRQPPRQRPQFARTKTADRILKKANPQKTSDAGALEFQVTTGGPATRETGPRPWVLLVVAVELEAPHAAAVGGGEQRVGAGLVLEVVDRCQGQAATQLVPLDVPCPAPSWSWRRAMSNDAKNLAAVGGGSYNSWAVQRWGINAPGPSRRLPTGI